MLSVRGFVWTCMQGAADEGMRSMKALEPKFVGSPQLNNANSKNCKPNTHRGA